MIKPYLPNYKNDLLQIIKLNTPQYFAPTEIQDFEEYLENEIESYFVIFENEKIVGSGGINFFEEKKLARISWDLIHPDYQGKGLGKKLLLFRIEEIKNNPIINTVQVRTSQLVFPFYQKVGFKLEKIEKDFWAEGLDLYQMNYLMMRTFF